MSKLAIIPRNHDKDSYFEMGFQLQHEGNYNAAAECYIRSIEMKPTPEAHTCLGWILAQLGDYEQAIYECKLALKLNPNYSIALNDLGVYFCEKQLFKKSLYFLRKALKSKNFSYPEYAHYNLAKVYLAKEEMLRAIAELKKSIRLNPSFRPAIDLLNEVEPQLH